MNLTIFLTYKFTFPILPTHIIIFIIEGGNIMQVMTRVIVSCFLFIIVAVTTASGAASSKLTAPPRSALPATDLQKKWDEAVVAAKSEGELLIYLNAPTSERDLLQDAFNKKFGIKLNIVIGSGSVISSRFNTEYRSGVHQVDVFLAGASSSMNAKEQGFLAPVEPILMLPEVADPSVWFGQGLPMFDKEGMILTFLTQVIPPVIYNKNMVKEGQITSYLDLLKPEWKGKMVLFDPTISGASRAWAGRLTQALGVEKANEFLTALVTQQDILVTREMGQQLEWVARGKFPLAIFPQTPAVSQYLRVGAPIEAAPFKEITGVSPSNGVLALPKYPPHPNATVVFVNWLLSREGQALVVKGMGVPSARLDVPPEGVNPMFVIKPGQKLFMQNETFEMQVRKWSKSWKKIFTKTRG